MLCNIRDASIIIQLRIRQILSNFSLVEKVQNILFLTRLQRRYLILASLLGFLTYALSIKIGLVLN